MANGVVDRAEWAVVVRELIDAEADDGKKRHGAKTRFAAKVGVSPRTVDTWLAGLVDVKESNVRAAADAYDRSAIDLLIRVGFYSLEQMPARTPSAEELDEERRAVLADPALDDRQKAYILQQLDEMEAADEQLIEQQRERDKKRRAERVSMLIEQHRRTA